MSEILSRTVYETCLADQTEAPWDEEVRLLLAHDAALRARVAELEAALTKIASEDTLHTDYCMEYGETSTCPVEIARAALASPADGEGEK